MGGTGRPTRWEYKVIQPPRGATKKEIEGPEPALNELGAEGWELVGSLDYSGGGTKYLVFKRPLDGEGTR